MRNNNVRMLFFLFFCWRDIGKCSMQQHVHIGDCEMWPLFKSAFCKHGSFSSSCSSSRFSTGTFFSLHFLFYYHTPIFKSFPVRYRFVFVFRNVIQSLKVSTLSSHVSKLFLRFSLRFDFFVSILSLENFDISLNTKYLILI